MQGFLLSRPLAAEDDPAVGEGVGLDAYGPRKGVAAPRDLTLVSAIGVAARLDAASSRTASSSWTASRSETAQNAMPRCDQCTV